jgi:hypothetical protein
MLVHLHAMRELRGSVKDRIETMLGEDTLHQRGVAKIALDACESGKRVLIALKVDIDDGVAFAQKATLQDSTEEAGGSSDKIMTHTEDCNLLPERKLLRETFRRDRGSSTSSGIAGRVTAWKDRGLDLNLN